MRSYETPKGPMQLLGAVLFAIGLALAVLLETPVIGIVLIVVGLLLCMSVLIGASRQP